MSSSTQPSGAVPMSAHPERHARAATVNAWLTVVAGCGHGFFGHKGRGAHFEVDPRGRIWFHDEYTQRRIYTHAPFSRGWRGFHHGGTLQALCRQLRDFIRSGTPLSPSTLGPYPDWYSQGDPWGYGADMDIVRAAARQVGLTVP
jgi:hypothetical protein